MHAGQHMSQAELPVDESPSAGLDYRMNIFELDPRLAADTVLIGEGPLSRVLLTKDARFPWLILVPRRPDKRDLIDLDTADSVMLNGESRQACLVLRQMFNPHKLNVAALGNVVAQLHVHVIARFNHDAAWPKPVWGQGEPLDYDLAALAERVGLLRKGFGFG
jgi:diadenosine tetraphosphate (Ap4A) HIT family hydrolase